MLGIVGTRGNEKAHRGGTRPKSHHMAHWRRITEVQSSSCVGAWVPPFHRALSRAAQYCAVCGPARTYPQLLFISRVGRVQVLGQQHFPNTMELRGKVAVVTGAGSGIGQVSVNITIASFSCGFGHG